MTSDNITDYLTASIRSIAASFPVLSSIAAGWSEYKNIRQANYIQEILVEFAKRITSIEESLNNVFLKSDEMKMLLEQVVIKAKDETVREKRICYSDFLKNAVTYELSDDSEKVMILETLSKLSISHIKMLFEVVGIINTNKNNITDENKHSWQYVQIKDDKLTTGYINENENINTANLDYMLAIGVVEMPIHRGSILSYETRSFTLSNLGWRVVSYLR